MTLENQPTMKYFALLVVAFATLGCAGNQLTNYVVNNVSKQSQYADYPAYAGCLRKVLADNNRQDILAKIDQAEKNNTKISEKLGEQIAEYAFSCALKYG